MIEQPLYAIPYTAPTSPTAPAGLLNAPLTGVMEVAFYAIIGLTAVFLMPGEIRASIRQLWAPVAAFLARLHAPLACGGVFLVCLPMGAVESPVCEERSSEDDEGGEEQVRSLAFKGYMEPILT